MNKKTLSVLAAIAISVTAMPALAQDTGSGQGRGGQELTPQKFEALKLVLLSRLKQKEACVQAAVDPQALRDCMMPGGGEGAGGGGGVAMHGGRPMKGDAAGGVNSGGPMMGADGGGEDGAPPGSNQ